MQDFLRNTVSNIRAVFRNRRKRFINVDVLDQDVSCIQNTYSPSIVHRELANSTRTQLGYRSGDVKVWQNVAKKKLKEIVCWQEPPKSVNGVKVIWKAEDRLGVYRKICLPSDCGTWMPAYVCIPYHRFCGKWIICMQGHTSGMHNSIGVDRESETYTWEPHGERDIATWCLGNGFAAICVEQRGLGERVETIQTSLSDHPCQDAAMRSLVLGRTLLGERLYDLGIVTQYLKDQHPNELTIGVMGHSLGGTMSIYAAALYDDISFCIASGCYSSFEKSILSLYHCVDLYVPGIRKLFEFGDLAGLIAPKSLLLIQGINDKLFPASGLRVEYSRTEQIYSAMRARNNLRLEIGQNGHRFYGQLATAGIKFLSL